MSDFILVTGGSGFIGQSLTKLLTARGHRTKVLVRTDKAKRIVESLGAESLEGDITDYASIAKGANGCSAVFHVAGLVSYKFAEKKKLIDVNVKGTENIIKMVKEFNIPKFIYCSTAVVLGGSDGRPLDEKAKYDGVSFSTYQESKCLAHDKVRQFSRTKSGVVIGMPSLVMGPGGVDILGVYMKAFCRGKLPFLIRLKNSVSYVFVDDVAEGLYLCMQKGKSEESYIFASDSCSFSDLAVLLSKYSGKRKPRELSPSIAKPLLVLDELFATLTGRIPPLTVESLKVLQRCSWVYSGRKAKEELGWNAISLDEMVKRSVLGM